MLTIGKEKLKKNFIFNKVEYLATKIKRKKKVKTVVTKKSTKTKKKYRKKQTELKKKDVDKIVEISLEKVIRD